jgi:uncharacterized spore protein YtfJ
MAVSKEQLTVSVKIDSKGAIKELAGVEEVIFKVGKSADSATKEIDQLQKGLGKTGSEGKKVTGIGDAFSAAFVPVTVLNQGIQLLQATFGSLASSIGNAVSQFALAEKAQINLEKALNLNAGAALNSAEAWDGYLDTLEKATGVNADILKDLAATSLQTGLSEEKTKNLIDASVRLSEVTGKEVTTSFQKLLASYKGAAAGLSVFAPQINSMTDDQLRNGGAVDAIAAKYENLKFSFSTSLQGAIEGTKIRFSDLTEAFGGGVAKALNLQTNLKTLQNVLAGLKNVVEKIDLRDLADSIQLFALFAGGVALIASSALRASLIKMASAAVAAAAPFLLIGTALTAFLVVIDLVARNTNRLTDVFSAVWSGITVIIGNAVSTITETLAGLFKSVGADSVGSVLDNYSKNIKTNVLVAKGELKELKNSGFDFGVVGTIFEKVGTIVDAFNGKVENTNQTLGKLGKVSVREPVDPKLLGDLSNTVKGILDLTKQYEAETETIGKNEFQQAELKRKANLLSIAQLDDQLIRLGKIGEAYRPIVQAAYAAASAQAEAAKLQLVDEQNKKSTQEALDKYQKVLDEIKMTQFEIGVYGKTQYQKAQELAVKEAEKLDKLREELRLQGLLTDERNAQIDASIKASSTKASQTPLSSGDAAGIGETFTAVDQAIGSSSSIGVFMSAAEGIVGAIQKLIDFIPNIINSVAHIFDSLADLPMNILKAVQNLIASAGKFIAKFIPDLFAAVPDILDSIITALFTELPKAFLSLIDKLPNIIDAFLQRIPDIVSGLISGLLAKMPILGVKLAIGFAVAILNPITWLKAAYYLTIGIAQGIRDAFYEIGDALAGLFDEGGSTLAKSVSNGISDAADSFKSLGTGIANQLFSVGEFSAVAAAQNTAKELGDSIIEGTRKAVGLLRQFWEGIKQFAKWLWNGIVEAAEAAGTGIKKFGTWIWDGLVAAAKKIGEWGQQIWDTFVEAGKEILKFGTWIWNGLVAAATTIGDWGKKIWDGLVIVAEAAGTGIKKFGGWIWDGIVAAVSGTNKFFSDFGTWIWDGFKSAFSGAGKFFEGLFSGIGNIFEKIFSFNDKSGKGTVEKFLGIDFPFVNFATGGRVPGRAGVFGDSLANDTVPALLSPGEAVIPRSLMSDPAVAKLVDGLLSGKGVGQHFLGIGGGTVVGKLLKGDVKGAVTDAGDNIASLGQSASRFFEKLDPTKAKELFDSLRRFLPSIDLKSLISNPFAYITNAIKNGAEQLLQGPMLNALQGAGLRFADGGMVPGQGNSDSVRSLLTPGEFVMSKRGVAAMGSEALQAMNNGNAPSGGSNVSNVEVHLTLNASEKIDASYVRDRLMPAIKDELRKESRRGGYIIAAAGVRS